MGTQPRDNRTPTPEAELLRNSVEEAARLLEADGAMIYLLDEATGTLRFAYDSGIDDGQRRRWVRRLKLKVGQGMFGVSVGERRVVVTDDYQADTSFPHGAEIDRFVREVDLRSMVVAPLVAGDRVFGGLGTFSSRPNAFSPAQIALVRALADHAAAALANALLIEELDRSRAEIARSAEAERALREIGARITAIHEPSELLQHVVHEATRLVRADGTILDLLDERTGRLYWAYDSGLSARFAAEEIAGLWLPLGVGVTGIAVAEDRVITAGDDLVSLFPPSPESDRFFETTGFRSLIAAPIVGEAGPLGALEVYSTRSNAFVEVDAELIRSLADQAAIAIQNARRIDELARSRSEITRRADTERALREIAAQITAITDRDEILRQVVAAAARLLGGTGGMIDLVGETGAEAWAASNDPDAPIVMTALDDVELSPEAGISGVAVSTRTVQWTGDYLADGRFGHSPSRDEFVITNGIKSVIAAPLLVSGEAVGAITIYDRRPDAFDEAAGHLLQALADQAAVAISNARLIDQLRRAREEVERRADVERSLRQIAKNITAIRDPDVILQQTVDEARRLLRSTNARIDLLEGDRLRWAYTSGEAEVARREALDAEFGVGEGAAGKAVREGRLVRIGDYLTDDSFVHTEGSDRFVRETGMHAVLAVPLFGEGQPLGAISVASKEIDAYDDADAQLLQALADQAAIAIQNARLIEALERSRADQARRAETERSLREMAARIAELRDPDELLRRIVDEASRLLGSDGAHMTRLSDDGSHLVPLVVSGGFDDVTEAWLKRQRFPVMGGINGLAAGLAQPVWTEDYLADPRIPHERNDDTATRLGLRGMAAVPLRSADGGIIGTLAVSYRVPHTFDAEELGVLKTLADHAAIAITNTSLLERLSESEARYRHLVQNSPDLIWSIDAEGRFTFVSDTAERLTGWSPEELLGRHFGALVHETSRDVAEIDWTLGINEANQELRGRLSLLHKDGYPIPAEFSAMTELDAEGRFAGANGAVRDMTERDRLERELRESEERYRFLVQNSPDVVFQIDDQGRFTYVGETIERMTGFSAAELTGDHFSQIVDPGSGDEAGARWAALVADPQTPQVVQINLRHRNGSTVPVEVSAVGTVGPNGRFEGIHGSTRDVTERERLARNLREQAAALAAGEERAHLARELHDSVTQALFSMTLLTRTTELLIDKDPDAAREKLGVLHDLEREALAEMRALIFELRPGNLEQDGLIRALKTHAAALQGRIGLPIVVNSGIEGRLPIDVEEVFYRIAQEALHNVVKHAGARQVTVDVTRDGRRARIEIADDGRGFDPANIAEGHLGLAGMKARAARLGGELRIRSRPGGGASVELVVPLPAEASPSAPGASKDGSNGSEVAAPGPTGVTASAE